MKWIYRLVPLCLFFYIVSLTPSIVRDSLADQQAKADLAEINHIMYGIFSVNSWKSKLADIIFGEIAQVDIKSTADQFKKTVENQLNAAIDKLHDQIKKANTGSFGGRVKQTLIDVLVDIEDIKKGVPDYAEAILNEIKKPETETQIKDLASQQLKEYFKKTFKKQNMKLIEAVLERTESKNVEEANTKLLAQIESRREGLTQKSWTLIGLSVLLCIWIAIPLTRTHTGIMAFFATLVVLLGIGVGTPMIDLEAKISEMSFQLVGHKILFDNQILYFQSKSVLDVFWLMITHKDFEMRAVGVLIVLFSVIFPVLKMLSSLAYYFGFVRAKNSAIIRFLVFKSGKWSMADVMVVAILMAYIGFNGIVETQFGKMHRLVPEDMVFITTNGTTLLLGFYMFLTYALLALVLSSLLDTSKARPHSKS